FAVAVHIERVHIGADRAERGAVKLPRRAVVFFGLLPPAVGAEDVDAAVAIDVAVPQAVAEAARARHFLAKTAGAADRVVLPELGRIGAGREVAHLPLIILALRLPGHDEDLLAVLEQVDIDRRLVAGAGGQDVLFPLAAALAGILIPHARFAGERHHHHVG